MFGKPAGRMNDYLNDPFKLSCTLLTLVGQWPYQKPAEYLPRRCFVLLVLSVFTFAQIRTFFVTDFDMDIVLKNAQLLGITLVGSINLITLYVNDNEYKNVVAAIYTDCCQPENEEEKNIKQKYLREGHMVGVFTTIFFSIVTSLSILLSCTPLILDVIVPLNHTRQRELLYYLDLYIDDQKYFVVYLIFYFSSVSLGITVFVANLCILIIAVSYTCGMFKALGYKLEHVFDITNVEHENEMIRRTDQAVYLKMIQCVKAHRETNRCSTLLETFLSPLMLQQFLCAAIVSSFSLAQVSNLEVSRNTSTLKTVCVPRAILAIFGFLTLTYESAVNVAFNCGFFFVVSSMGQKLINISTETGEKIYNGKWYNSPVRAQKLLLIVLKCYTPHTLHGFKIVHLSLETALAIAKTAVSYCLMLRTI